MLASAYVPWALRDSDGEYVRIWMQYNGDGRVIWNINGEEFISDASGEVYPIPLEPFTVTK